MTYYEYNKFLAANELEPWRDELKADIKMHGKRISDIERMSIDSTGRVVCITYKPDTVEYSKFYIW